jgi:hypothetical protein
MHCFALLKFINADQLRDSRYYQIRMALRDMKCGKAPGVDNITAELLKADIETSVDKLHKIIIVEFGESRELQRIGTEDL